LSKSTVRLIYVHKPLVMHNNYKQHKSHRPITSNYGTVLSFCHATHLLTYSVTQYYGWLFGLVVTRWSRSM